MPIFVNAKSFKSNMVIGICCAGIIIAVMVGVVLGVTLGVSLLCVVVHIRRR